MVIYRNDPILAACIRDVSQYKMISDSEQRELASEIQSYVAKIGEYEEKLVRPRVWKRTKARIREELPVLREELRDLQTRLTEANMRFALFEGKKHTNRGLEYLDLIQEGSMQMFDKATTNYDPNDPSNSKFVSYTSWWIWQGITRAIADKSRMIRLKGQAHSALLKVKKFSSRFLTEKGRLPYPDEISELTGIPLDKVELVLEHTGATYSLDTPVEGENGDTFADVVPYENDSELSKGPEYSSTIEFLINHTNLKPEEKRAVELRYGLSGQDPMTFREVGEEMGFTREWARQIEIKALKKFRETAERYDIKLEDIL